MEEYRDIFAIGSSLGGVQALAILFGELPGDLAASLLVAQHTSPDAALDQALALRSRLPVSYAKDGERLERGRIYIAPPDRHMLVGGNVVRITRGPRENGTRPAIDRLFRSAAAHFGPRVVGIVLTGMRDDGTAGLDAIKRSGGIIVVQDPDDASHPEMPRSALSLLDVDYVVPLAEMSDLIVDLSKQEVAPGKAPDDVVREAEVDAGYGADDEPVHELGSLTSLDCPECGGPLWRIGNGSVGRFRCRIGHAFSERALASSQGDQAERSLLVALRTLEERGRMLHRLAEQSREREYPGQAERFARERDETMAHAGVLRALLTALG